MGRRSSFHPQSHGPDRSRIPVRVGALEATLENFNAEMAQKTALLMSEYHAKFVEPRLRRLEMPWYRRWWGYLLFWKASEELDPKTLRVPMEITPPTAPATPMETSPDGSTLPAPVVKLIVPP